jgi:hypothetical protein
MQQPAIVSAGDDGELSVLDIRVRVTDGTDCVTLNDWKPTNAQEGDKLRVVIYIHVRDSKKHEHRADEGITTTSVNLKWC